MSLSWLWHILRQICRNLFLLKFVFTQICVFTRPLVLWWNFSTNFHQSLIHNALTCFVIISVGSTMQCILGPTDYNVNTNGWSTGWKLSLWSDSRLDWPKTTAVHLHRLSRFIEHCCWVFNVMANVHLFTFFHGVCYGRWADCTIQYTVGVHTG